MMYQIKINPKDAEKEKLIPAPCPFCGGRDIKILASGDVVSIGCKCGGQVVRDFCSLEAVNDCIRQWNIRAIGFKNE